MNHAATINADRESDRAARRRPRVLLSAYSCCPNWGSEPGVGWNRATEIAKYCDTWVITRSDGMQPRIEAYLQEHGPIPNLEFVFVPRERWELAIAARGPLRYFSYRCWAGRALRVARRLHAQVGFDVAHHVTFSGFREPSSLYQLGIPFVWGPVGGVQNYPWRFLAGAGLKGGLVEATRSMLNMLQLRTSSRIRAAARSASAIFVANPETQRGFRNTLGVDSIPLSDVGAATPGNSLFTPRTNSDQLRILWAGNLATWKALELLIEALALLPSHVEFVLHVIGDGPRLRNLQRLAEKKGVAPNVHWCGRLLHHEVLEKFRWADVFAFTSLRDTTGTVVLEALAAGKPILCLDHQGVGAIVTPECGVKIPVSNRRDVERKLADAIVQLQRNRDHCHKLGEGARLRATEYLWSLQARRIAEEYNRILESQGSTARCKTNEEIAGADNLWQELPTSGRVAPV